MKYTGKRLSAPTGRMRVRKGWSCSASLHAPTGGSSQWIAYRADGTHIWQGASENGSRLDAYVFGSAQLDLSAWIESSH